MAAVHGCITWLHYILHDHCMRPHRPGVFAARIALRFLTNHYLAAKAHYILYGALHTALHSELHSALHSAFHSALHSALHGFLTIHYLAAKAPPREGWTGSVQHECSPSERCEHAARLVEARCLERFGRAPAIRVQTPDPVPDPGPVPDPNPYPSPNPYPIPATNPDPNPTLALPLTRCMRTPSG